MMDISVRHSTLYIYTHMGEVTTLPTQDIFEPKLKPPSQTVDPIDQTTYKEHHASRVSPENPFVSPPRISIGALSSSVP
jgi:hypothetical protein